LLESLHICFQLPSAYEKYARGSFIILPDTVSPPASPQKLKDGADLRQNNAHRPDWSMVKTKKQMNKKENHTTSHALQTTFVVNLVLDRL